MIRLVCPHCPRYLERRINPRLGAHWVCTGCKGTAILTPAVRKTTNRKDFEALWGRSLAVSSGTPCPSCARSMRQGSPADDDSLVIETCRRCQLFWFDVGEPDDVIARPLHSPPETKPLDPENLRLLKKDFDRAVQDVKLQDDPNPTRMLFAALLLPVEHEKMQPLRRAWVTWSLVALLVLVGMLTGGHWEAVAEGLGFVPAEFGPASLSRILTSFFVHAGWLHLLINAYFLFTFGDDVEAALGPLRYLALLGSGILLGDVIHGIFTTRPDLPLVGASGGISAVLCFYALTFPHNRIGFFSRHGSSMSGHYGRLTAMQVFLFWIGLQVVLTIKQIQGTTNISALGHLGGVLAGATGWWLWNRE